jgi:formylglycine-generating enzyme required for sulfatase activity
VLRTRIAPALVNLKYEDLSAQTSGVDEFLSEVARFAERHKAQMVPSGRFPVGLFASNELGCYDLFGNVWEWCDTWLPETSLRPSVTEESVGWPAVVKGGAWKRAASPAWLIMAVGSTLIPGSRN